MTVTLVCTIQIWPDHRHADADADAVSVSASGSAVVTMPPMAVSYVYVEGRPSVLCAEVTLTDARGNTAQFYWDDQTWTFSTDPGSECLVVACWSGCGPSLLEILLRRVFEATDPAVCPVLPIWCPPEENVPGSIRSGDAAATAGHPDR